MLVNVVMSRRDVLSLPLALMANSTSSSFIDLSYSAGRLTWPDGAAAAVCGRAGVSLDKREGDGASPAGRFPLLRCFYRADRLPTPRCGLPLQPIRRDDGWVDAPDDPNYNRLVALPYPADHEELWRSDGLYDIIVVIGYNTDPPIPSRGSAIFLHVASPDFAPTAGCIAIGRDVLLSLLPRLGTGSTITIAT